MEESKQISPARIIGPLSYLIFLLRGPLLVTLAVVVILVDLVIPGTVREAMRYALVDPAHWYQLVVIGAALLIACAAVRSSGEAMVELVAPDLYGRTSPVRRLARFLPRLLALSLGIAVTWPIFQIVSDWSSLLDTTNLHQGLSAARAASATGMAKHSINDQLFAARALTAAVGAVYLFIAVFVALLTKGPRAQASSMRDPSLPVRLGFGLFPLLLAATFAAAVIGVSKPGIAYHALERYSSAVISIVSDPNTPNNALWRWVYKSAPDANAAAEQAKRYGDYITRTNAGNSPDDSLPYVAAKYSLAYMLAMLASLFAACYVLRLGMAAFLDVIFPGMGRGGRGARFARRLLPPLVSTGLGLVVAGQFVYAYFLTDPPVRLFGYEPLCAAAIVAAYILIGLAASIGSGSRFADNGLWRESRSVGRRFQGAARRLAALGAFWQWFIGCLLFLGLLFFLLFADLRLVAIPQWIGPIGIVLLWCASATALLFVLTYTGHMTRIPLLSILIVAAGTYAGFDINSNHQIRTIDTQTASAAAARPGQTLNLADWMKTRADRDMYDHYPVFLVATEGGGIRAAYFTADVLAALQERCPAFAQHTIAISGVSGGSLGAGIFAALTADQVRNDPNPGCNLAGLKKNGALTVRAQNALSTDLLSPLLGATLFPDALQRFLPFPIPVFDRSRALEYAVQDAWRRATTGNKADCGLCLNDRMADNVNDLYARDDNAVPNLFLNTTEAGSGQIMPYITSREQGLGTPFRDSAQIDNGDLDCMRDGTYDPFSCITIPNQTSQLAGLARNMDNRPIRLSTAAIISARFPYLTPAGSVPLGNGEYVDGGYFENSGTFLLSGLVQYLIGQQYCLAHGQDCPGIDASAVDPDTLKVVSRAVFVVIVIKSEPCTRNIPGTGCQEDLTVGHQSWSELLSPLRALLSTRAERADVSLDNLRSMAALIEQMHIADAKTPPAKGAAAGSEDDGIACDDVVCAVTLRFLNRRNTEIPLTWLLSSGARHHMDRAVRGMERADVRYGPPAASMTNRYDTRNTDRVLGSYRRLLCMLAARKDASGPVCTTGQPPAAAEAAGNGTPARPDGPPRRGHGPRS